MRPSTARSRQLHRSCKQTTLTSRTTPPRTTQLPPCHHCSLTPSTRSSPLLISSSIYRASARYSSTSAAEPSTPPQNSPAAPRTHYDLFPLTLPRGPPPAGDFKIDLRALRKEFLRLQAVAHPDLASPSNKARAEGLSASINEAYKTLQSPLLRAQYLLSLQGVSIEEGDKLEDGAGEGDGELLMEVLEARETIEDAEEEGELEGLRTVNEERIREVEGELERVFREGDVEGCRRGVVRLRYWVNIRESLDGWEKGKGVPNLVH